MSLGEILALAVALSMDALAVAIGVGLQLRDVSGRQTFRLAFHFGLFQALMPILGWTAGLAVADHIQSVDHWVAFSLLAFVGCKMVWEGLKGGGVQDGQRDPTRGLNLLLLSVATSIDALAVGLTLAILDVSVVGPAIAIGVTCALITAVGVHAGKLVSRLGPLQRWADLLGGVVLLVIGVRILHEHQVF